MFFQLTDADKASRSATVERFMRQRGGQLGLSQVIYLDLWQKAWMCFHPWSGKASNCWPSCTVSRTAHPQAHFVD